MPTRLALIAGGNQLFKTTNVLSCHLIFSAESFEAMTPIQRGPRFGPFNFQSADTNIIQAINTNEQVIRLKRNGPAAMGGTEYFWVSADVDFNGIILSNIAVRYKGNNTFMESRDTLKKPFKLDLNKFVRGQSILGVSKINLHNMIVDASCMSDTLSYMLFREAGVPAPGTAFVKVYLTVKTNKYDHQYLGLYLMVENVDDMFIASRFGTKKGLLLKPVTMGGRQLFDYLGDDWQAYQQIYNPTSPGIPEQYQRVIDLARLVSRADKQTFDKMIGDFIDLDEFARFMAVTVYLSNLDSILAMGQNYYMYLSPISGKFIFIPWDLDHSFGNFPMFGSEEERINLSILKPYAGENLFLSRMFENKTFINLYLKRFKEFQSTIFSTNYIFSKMKEIASIIRDPIAMESPQRLERFEVALSEKTTSRTNNSSQPGFPGFTRNNYLIKQFIYARAQAIENQLTGKSKGKTLSRGGFGPPPMGGGGNAFDPISMLANAIVAQADTNKDKKISKDELMDLARLWFDKIDSQHSERIDEQTLQNRISELIPFGPPQGFGGPPQEGTAPVPMPSQLSQEQIPPQDLNQFGPPPINPGFNGPDMPDQVPPDAPRMNQMPPPESETTHNPINNSPVEQSNSFNTARLPQPRPQPRQQNRFQGRGFGGPGVFLVPMLMQLFDTDKNGFLEKQEFLAGCERLFSSWDTKKTGFLTQDDLVSGLNKDLNPFNRGGRPQAFFGGPRQQ